MIDETRDEARRTLARMQAGDRFAYWQDFGDDWSHDIRVESVGRIDPARFDEINKALTQLGTGALQR